MNVHPVTEGKKKKKKASKQATDSRKCRQLIPKQLKIKA
jgi:hypothetical protein